MIVRRLSLFAFFVSITSVGCQSRWSIDSGLSTPESAIYDASADNYIVSNINGDPFGSDGVGYLSRVSPDGKVVEEKWVDGAADGVTLNAPKGMALVDDVLWVADVHYLRRFDLKSGEPLGAVEIPRASFLNDLTTGSNGAVYVSDTGLGPGFVATETDAIYEVRGDGRVRTVVKSKELGQPNGLLFSDGKLLMVNWAKGQLVGVSLSGETEILTTLPFAQLDGIEALPDGNIIISSWAGSCLFKVAPDASAISVYSSELDKPADLGYDPKRGRLLVPWFGESRLTAH